MLNSTQRKHLRGLAHHLEPVIHVGQKGVTDSVVAETGRALESHELIKVRLDAEGRDKKPLAEDLASKTSSEIAGLVGKIVILYKAREKDPKIEI